MLDPTLKSKINQLWDKFWSGGISNPLQAIEQMSYLLFMKRLEDEDIAREQDAQLSGKPYQSIFTDNQECKWSKWSKWSNYPADTILYHVRDKAFPFLRNLGGEDSLYEIYMKDAVFAIPTPSLLVEVVAVKGMFPQHLVLIRIELIALEVVFIPFFVLFDKFG